MVTSLTLRSTKGAPLTHNEVDANFTALRDTADAAANAVTIAGVSILAEMPTAIRDAVIAGTNTADLAPYINIVLAQGGVIDTHGYEYIIKSRIIPAENTHLTGNGTFLAHLDFSDATYGDGLEMMLNVVDGLTVDLGITFDGNSITTSSFWLTGARNTSAVSDVTLDCTFRNLSFNGVDISRNGGSWSNLRVAVRGNIENVGWTGANIEGVTDLNTDGLRVERTGWHGIFVSYGFNAMGQSMYVNKANPPYRIYDGAGSYGGVEKGFMLSHFSLNIFRWTDFLLYDNRNAGFDGFGIGEDGPLADPESANGYVTGQIWYAGLFGFDVSSDMVADIQVWFPADQGVQFGLDLGGTLANIDIKAQVFDNIASEAARFSATGPAVRTCTFSSGSSTLTIASGSGFFIAPGQKITGTNIPANAYVGTYNGTTVTMVTAPGGATPAVTTGAGPQSITFRGIINFQNCHLDIRTANCTYGVGIESGADGYATYTNCSVSGDTTDVTIGSIRRLNGDYPAGMRVENMKFKDAAEAVSGTSFAAQGNDTFVYSGGGTLSTITGGYEGQEITVFVNATDMTLNFDWAGAGLTRLIGNNNVDKLVKAGGMWRARYRSAVGWYVDEITQPTAEVPGLTSAVQISYDPVATGSVARTLKARLDDIVSRSDFSTLANAWAGAGFKPRVDPTTGKLWLNTDASALDYSTSRAGLVFQHRDTASGATNELIPSAVFQFNATGNGTVNAGIELSQTIWSGQFNYMKKTGDGSAHTFTAIGELGAYGPGAYNELGMFQGEATNTGSALGTMSGVEMLLKDSPDSGASTYSTKMQAVVGRIAKYNPTSRKSHNFYASCEGTQAIDAILGGNPGGLASWLRGFDFQGLTFTTGQFGLAPNNTFLAWLRSGGAAAPVIGVNNADDVFIAATNASGRVDISTSSFATRLAVDSDASNAVLVWVGGSLKRVTEGAADSAGAGYKQLRVPN